MNVNTILLKTLVLFTLILSVSACSDDDDLVYDAGPAGPDTEQTLKSLPDGLVPDRENARHSGN
ncbi:hypothetical protein [Emcibacter sp.]|uniref:hypothetical protein n=1 Tax=Emcibacter sp. TaxID=1979954 RepID=UPI003A950595